MLLHVPPKRSSDMVPSITRFTVKPDYKDHLGPSFSGLCRQVVLIQRYSSITEVAKNQQPTVVSVDRWCRGAEVSPKWPMEQPRSGLCRQVTST
jgi:hypothetical protein